MPAPCLDRPWNRETTRKRFILESGDAYAMGRGDAAFTDQRAREYPALKDTVYLDHAASPPAPLSTLHAFTESLSKTLYSNPHSRSTSSLKTSDEIAAVRTCVLSDLCGVATPESRSRWDVIFTSGATAALKLVAESYPWSQGTQPVCYRYLKEAHTSLVGIRGCALEHGADVDAMDNEETERWLASPVSTERELFAYPAQCNATGSRLGCELAQRAKRRDRGTSVLVDAAAWLATKPMNLDSIPFQEAPDFIVCSFYKLFGYPTGLGCLVVKLSDSGSARLTSGSRSYFGGGTIDAISVDRPFWSFIRRSHAAAFSPPSPTSSPSSARSSPLPRTSSSSSASHTSSTPPTSISCDSPARVYPPIHDSLEDGTLPFLSIVALNHALRTHRILYTSHDAVSAHVTTLASFARWELSAMRHATGLPVVRLHSAFGSLAEEQDAGPTIAFTLVDPDSNPIGHVFLERLATINSFQLRTGGLCNTGVVRQVGDLNDAELLEGYHKGRRCWDDEEFFDDDHSRPSGLARISLGAASTIDDVLDFLVFVRSYFLVSKRVALLAASPARVGSGVTLQSLVLYPIKSCGGQVLSSSQPWEIAATGLAFDREWMLVSPSTGQTLSQKRIPRMALIRPVVDPVARLLRITAEGMDELVLPLEQPLDAGLDMTNAQLCGDVVSVCSSTSAIDTWFSSFLGVACRLYRVPASGADRHGHFDRALHPISILLSNESPFLLISQPSVDQVNAWIDPDAPIDPACFRANFILAGPTSTPFFEDDLKLLRIGDATFQVLARCRRCLMVCVDQATGCKTREPFSCLAKTRKSTRGRIEFGVHLLWREDLSGAKGAPPRLRVGDEVAFSNEV